MESRCVFMFSGQGSQYHRMGRELFDQDPFFRREATRLDDVARRLTGRSCLASFMDGDPTAIDEAAIRGVDIFRSQTRGRCINCHENAELTGASVRRVRESPTRIREGQALDRGFNDLGVLSTLEDPGVGGKDALGNPLSTVRRLATPPAEPIAVDGAMKVPGLRNVALTAPYGHNGYFASLKDVVHFYNTRDVSPWPRPEVPRNVNREDLGDLHLSAQEEDCLVSFLNTLSDGYLASPARGGRSR